MKMAKIVGLALAVLAILAAWTVIFHYLGLPSRVEGALWSFILGKNPSFVGWFVLLLAIAGLITYFGVVTLGVASKNPIPKEFVYPAVSIIIPAKDEAPLLQRTLETVASSDYPKNKMQVILVTSNSTDDSERMCQEFIEAHPEIDWTLLSDPLDKPGKPHALNHGLEHVKNEILVVYDAGCMLLPDTLKMLVSAFKDEAVMASQGSIIAKNWNKNGLTKAIAIDYAIVSGGNMHFEAQAKFGKNCWLYGRNMAVRMDVIRRLNAFDEDSLTEDVYLASLMNANGLKIVFVPHARMYEMVPSDWPILKKQRARWVGGFTGDIPRLLQLKVNGKPAGPKEMLGRYLSMQFIGNISIWSLFCLVATVIYLVIGEFYLAGWSFLCYAFNSAWILMGINRYADNRFGGLLGHIFGTMKIHAFMFSLSGKLPKVINWEQTPQLLTMSKEELANLVGSTPEAELAPIPVQD
jgi:biofilm PGA synthesis N-glycosyltransferase PgaC